MTDTTIVTRREGWLTAWVGDELMMMSGDTGSYMSLSETGGRIWEMLDRSDTVEHLCECLAREYQVDREEAKPELLHFLGQMLKENTIFTSQQVQDE